MDKEYKPLAIAATEDLGEVSRSQAEDVEHMRTRELMKVHGWQNVRGGRFTTIEYKKLYGILWRVNTEKDMPTIDTLYAIHVVVVLSIIVIIQAYLMWR